MSIRCLKIKNTYSKKIMNVVDAEKPDGVIIAGDVYDKSVPAAEAVQLLQLRES